jgi:hypothetical protein
MNGGARRHGTPEDWRRTPVLIVVVALLSVAVLAAFVRAFLIAPLHVPIDPNEGWNAYHAAGSPYPPPGAFMINNYPPLSFYLVGLLGACLGDNIVAGRFVSLAAFAGICLFIAVVLRQMNAGWTAALFGALLFASTLLFGSDYVGMDDPQLLGHALQLAGLLFVLQRPRNWPTMLVSGVLFVTGGFIKHNLFALPLASLAWLAFCDRYNALRLLAGVFVLTFAAFIAAQATLGISLLHHLNSARMYSLRQMGESLRDWMPLVAIPLCALFVLMFQSRRDEAARLAIVYAAIAVASGALLLGGAGVDVNAMFDADIALTLCAGLAISRWPARETPFWRASAQIFPMLCILPLVLIALRAPDWRDPSFWLAPLREEAALAKTDVAFLRGHPGPAMCENLTFCYWAGKEGPVDVFNLDQQFETGSRDPNTFLRLLRSRSFDSVELDETSPFPFPKRVENVFNQYYRIDHQNDEGIFFVPR